MRSARGSLLLTVLAVLAVLSTVALALHWQQSRARAAYLREEASLQVRQAADYQLATQNSTGELQKPALQVNASSEAFPAKPYDTNSGARLFTGLPDLAVADPLSWDGTRKAFPGNRWIRLEPVTMNASLMLMKRQMVAVVSTTNPYAALAPRGSVTLESAEGWANATYLQTAGKNPAQMFSAVPARVGAQGKLAVQRCGYGELYSVSGPMQLGEGAAVARKGFLPFLHRSGADYPERLIDQQLGAAGSALSARAQDKTTVMKGGVPSIGDVFGLVTGSKSFEQLVGSTLSLRQGMGFPLPMIPGGNEMGIVTNIWLHVPFPPDPIIAQNADKLNQMGATMQDLTKKIEEKIDEIKKKTTEIVDLKSQLAGLAAANPTVLVIKNAIELAEKAIDLLNDNLLDLVKQSTELGADSKSLVDSIVATANPDNDGPDTRTAEEDLKLGEDGQFGWAYTPVFVKIGSIVLDLVSGQFEKLGEDTHQKVRLVHFGPKDNKTQFNITDSDFACVATMNVPSGRSLRFDGNLTITGDLWMQRGSSLIVNGNLTLVNPSPVPSNDLLTPSGKLCLEEGASVVVSGDFACAGGPRTGSILVESPVNAVHPVTVGLLAQGDVTVPFGIYPAITLPDPQSILTVLSANLAKAAGPFHRRKPYFATYATTFQIYKIPPPFPAVIPMAMPLTTPKNVLNPVFNTLSIIYTVQLNLALGENFVTNTDWWFMGQGVVPMVPKIDPASMVGLTDLSVPGLPSSGTVVQFVKAQALEAGQKMATELASTVVTQLVKSQLGFPMSLVGDFADSAVKSLSKWITKSDEAENLAGKPGSFDLSKLADPIAKKLAGGDAGPMLAECGGMLLFSGKSLSVGAAPLAVGYLVARGDIVCQSEFLVGAALSQNGSITARKLLYVPEFTRATFYLPRDNPGLSWLEWAIEPSYGASFDSGQAVQVGAPVPHYRTDSWEY